MSSLVNMMVSPLLTVAGAFKKPKPPKVPPQMTSPSRTTALSDALLRRQGTGDNQRSGMGGAEYGGGKKTKLGG